jgi:hypothetical protein
MQSSYFRSGEGQAVFKLIDVPPLYRRVFRCTFCGILVRGPL